MRGKWIAVAVAAGLCGGCGGDAVRVTGRLVKNGQPYTAKLDPPKPETFSVDFSGTVDGKPYLFSASMNADGTFRVDGAGKAGIPRGTYKIAVLHAGFLGEGGDRFNARFAPDKTPLTVDVTGPTELTVDIGAGTVTK